MIFSLHSFYTILFLSTMSTTSRVTHHSVLTVVSSKPVGSVMAQPLSPLNHSMALHTLHIIFYYNHNLLGSFELDPLRESLNQVLSLYPMLTGRLAQGSHRNWEVRCNDAGVRVIIATVDTTLDEWLGSAAGSEETHLTAWDDMPDDPHTWSPFRIQINQFQGGGVAIGLSCTHLLADITWLFSFFKAWTQAYRHLPITHPPISTPNPLRAPPLPHMDSKSPTYYATKSSKKPLTPSPKMGTATFKFSSSMMKQWMSQVVHPICPNATPFDILLALFWTRVSRLKPPRTDQTDDHSLSICIDFRTLLKPPLPIGYFGNALHFSLLKLKASDMESSALGHIAGLIHRHLEGIEEGEIWSAIDWFESEGGKFRSPTCMYGPELTCVCMEHMIIEGDDKSLIYEAIFHEEKAAHVSCHVGKVEGEGLIMVMPSAEGGLGRTVMVMLPEEEVSVLCEDEAILQLQPTMLLTGGLPLTH